MGDFHASHFDDATKLKLELFRGYIREWLGVFLAKRSYPEIHIYDFFCGPGTDLAGHPGSPMLILEELEGYFENPKVVPPEDVEIFVHFNDIKKSNISNLEIAVEARENKSRCKVRYTSLDFAEAFQKAQPSLKRADTANLLILDQCGIKAITEHIEPPPIFRQIPGQIKMSYSCSIPPPFRGSPRPRACRRGALCGAA